MPNESLATPPPSASPAPGRILPAATASHARPPPLSISEWRDLAAHDPERAAQELTRRLRSAFSRAQQRACFAHIAEPDALAAAFERATRPRRAGRDSAQPPLAGVPYALKDLFHSGDGGTLAGSGFPAGVLPKKNTADNLPRALERAGAVLAARTHLYEFAYGLTGENAHHGDCEHPHFPGRTTGGSSSGSAASVAAGIVPFATGTDTGGSIRVPAAFCGLFGMRLTPGDEWIEGAFPLAPEFDTAGWFTRTAEDMRELATALLGPFHSPQNEPRGCFLDLAALGHSAASTREVARVVRDAGKKYAPLADRTTREQLVQAFHGAPQSYAILQSIQAYKVHARWLDKHREHYTPEVWHRIDRGRRWSPSQIDAAAIKHRAVRAMWASFFKTYDYLVMPAAPFTALPKLECTALNRDRIISLTSPASLGGLPVLTVPVPLASGLSAGLQIIVADPRSAVIAWALKRSAR